MNTNNTVKTMGRRPTRPYRNERKMSERRIRTARKATPRLLSWPTMIRSSATTQSVEQPANVTSAVVPNCAVVKSRAVSMTSLSRGV